MLILGTKVPQHFFQFIDPIYSRWDSLDGGSARPKASTYT
jgi:hypothetical protein